MMLALDIGNSQIYGGVFEGGDLIFRFRRNSKTGASSDELGVFLRSVLRENDIDPKRIRQIALCTVVPEALHSLRNACMKYFKITPFVLQAGVKTGLRIRYKNPLEVGADRIANAVAATQLYPKQNLIIVDFGTATTFCAISADRDYLGGVIHAGLRISMEALEQRTSKLPSVEIIAPTTCVGRSTVESIQSGLFFGAVGAIREVLLRITKEVFLDQRPLVIGTGGFASLFSDAEVFDKENPDLVLWGIYFTHQLNQEQPI